MDFFERQTKARRNTKWLVVYFALAVVMIILSVYLLIAVGLSAGSSRHHRYSESLPALSLWQPQIFLWVTLGTFAVITIGSAAKMMELSQGGSAVAEMLGGAPINLNTTDADERKLLNVVEEMAIASGTPVPQVYLLPAESINAFAAGHSTSDMVIGVTRGCMRLLTRDELQGVIGHEFSHILNGDMRLNIQLIGFIFGIMGLAIVGRILMQVRSGNSRDRNPLPLLGLALLLIGSVGVFFGRLIQSAVSRQREFLADASAVQFTRNPEGLAGALKKIGGLAGSQLESSHAVEASHLFFANGLGNSFFNLMATHPALEERIRAIDPAWDGKFIHASAEEIERRRGYAPAKPRPQAAPPIIPGFPPLHAGAAGFAPPSIRAADLLPSLGNPTTAHLRYAADWHAALPASLEAAAHEPLGSSAIIYALLLSADEAVRSTQIEQLGNCVPAEAVNETIRLLPDVAGTSANAKLPLVDLTLPGLRGLSPAQFQQLTRAIQALVEADGEIDLFEYVLQKIVIRHLEPHFAPARKPTTQYYTLRPLLPDCAVLLSALAQIGHDEAGKAAAAFRLGWRELRAADIQADVFPITDCDLDKVDAALNRLAQAVPQIKKNLLNACAVAVAADGMITVDEAELLRAIADALDCPVPPFVEGVKPAE